MNERPIYRDIWIQEPDDLPITLRTKSCGITSGTEPNVIGTVIMNGEREIPLKSVYLPVESIS